MRRDVEKRGAERVRLEEPVVIDVDNDWTMLGTATDVSVGGMFIEVLDQAKAIAFGTRVTLHVRLSGELLELPAVVRWTRAEGVGVQFGLLGARETHAITEAIGRHAPSRTRERAATLETELEVDVEVDDVERTG